jgi:thiamine transport system substrate-binding protein
MQCPAQTAASRRPRQTQPRFQTQPQPGARRGRIAAAFVIGILAVTSAAACAKDDNPAAPATVKLIAHDSFAIADSALAAFTEQTGLEIEVISAGDAGAMVNQLILTKDAPLGDVVFGIDNTFAARALDAGILAQYRPGGEYAKSEAVLDPAIDQSQALTAIDFSDVCVNVDHAWFDEHQLAEPATLDDLADPAYASLLVVENPATSSPGLAFLLATIAAKGEDGWADYWHQLAAGGAKVVDGWSDAYYVDFSGSSGQGERPLVVSYASSPPSEVPDGATSAATGALLDTCFRQVEYAAVLEGAANPAGAQALVDFMQGREFQDQVAETMWVYPASRDGAIPESWELWAPLAPNPWKLDPARIAAGRDGWIEQWTQIVAG